MVSLNIRFVQTALLISKSAEENLLILLRQIDMFLDVLFHPPEEVGTDGVPEDRGALEGCGHLNRAGIGISSHGDGSTELLQEYRQSSLNSIPVYYLYRISCLTSLPG